MSEKDLQERYERAEVVCYGLGRDLAEVDVDNATREDWQRMFDHQRRLCVALWGALDSVTVR